MGNSVINTNEKDMVVVSTPVKVGLFSTASIDNIDLEIKSSLVTTSIHGTAASINQHSTDCHLGTDREVLPLSDSRKELQDLPQWYTVVVPFQSPNDHTKL